MKWLESILGYSFMNAAVLLWLTFPIIRPTPVPFVTVGGAQGQKVNYILVPFNSCCYRASLSLQITMIVTEKEKNNFWIH